MSAAERASEASSAEQANGWAVRANERTEKRVAQYYARRFHCHSTHRATSSFPWSGAFRAEFASKERSDVLPVQISFTEGFFPISGASERAFTARSLQSVSVLKNSSRERFIHEIWRTCHETAKTKKSLQQCLHLRRSFSNDILLCFIGLAMQLPDHIKATWKHSRSIAGDRFLVPCVSWCSNIIIN